MDRPLGRLQRSALSSLARLNSGTWTPGCGWVIESVSRTVQVLDSLVERGHAARASATCRYTITESGLSALGWASCRLCTRLTRLAARPVIAAPGRTTCSWCTAAPADEAARDRATACAEPVPPVLVRAR